MIVVSSATSSSSISFHVASSAPLGVIVGPVFGRLPCDPLGVVVHSVHNILAFLLHHEAALASLNVNVFFFLPFVPSGAKLKLNFLF